MIESSPVGAEQPKPSVEIPEQTQVDIRFTHPISLLDAIRVTTEGQVPVLAYRFENDQMTGEYSPQSGTLAEEYLRGMVAKLGTEPEVVGYSVGVSSNTQRRAEPALVDVGSIPEFDAPAISPAYFEVQRSAANAARTENTDSGSNRAAGDWRPELIQTKIETLTNRAFFDMALFWDTPSTPGYIPADYGLEVGVELYNGASGNLRPFCASGYKDQFFAKNYGWNWYAVDEQFGAMTAAEPYADYNDATDECFRNSMSLGLRTPQAIPLSYSNAPWDWMLFMYIDAPGGTQSSNRISGNASLVTESWCTSYPSYSSTDCMGVSRNGSPVATTDRGFLNEARYWTAPDKCWTSAGKGATAPVLTFSSPSGC